MTEETSPAPANKERTGKLILLFAVVAAIAVVWYVQRRAPVLSGWSKDLPAALGEGKAQDRRVLILFTDSPPGETTRQLLSQFEREDNKEAIAKAKLITVEVPADEQLKKQYEITGLPAMILLDPQGKELNRREGRETINETGFRDDFLTLKNVVLPPSKRKAVDTTH